MISSNIEYPKVRQQGTMQIYNTFPAHASKVNSLKTIHNTLGDVKHMAPHKVSYQAHIPDQQEFLKMLDLY
jgi:hypothetical protein